MRKQTCIVNGVSFFLFMVLSSMVSGTERLTILLENKRKRNNVYTRTVLLNTLNMDKSSEERLFYARNNKNTP